MLFQKNFIRPFCDMTYGSRRLVPVVFCLDFPSLVEASASGPKPGPAHHCSKSLSTPKRAPKPLKPLYWKAISSFLLSSWGSN